MKKSLYILLIVFLISSCSFFKTDDINLKIRASFSSEGNGAVTVFVWPENKEGNIVTGAVVTVTDSSNQVWHCEFNNSKQVYSTEIESSSESFKIRVVSNLLDEPFEKIYPHKIFSEKPVLKSFTDESGNNVLSGKSLSPGEKILIAWNDLGTDIVYQVQVRSAASVKWSSSCSLPSIEVPADVLTEGTYYLQIIAQWISGDAVYEKEDYYSLSAVTSSSLSFFVE